MEGPSPQTFKEHSPTRRHHPIARFLHVTIGLISSLFAMLTAGALFMTIFIAITQDAYRINLPGLIAEFLAFTVFLGLVGVRLISDQGAKAGGGLLSPMGYRLVGVILGLLAMLAFFALFSETPTVGIAVIGHVGFGAVSVLCFVAAHWRAKEISQ